MSSRRTLGPQGQGEKPGQSSQRTAEPAGLIKVRAHAKEYLVYIHSQLQLITAAFIELFRPRHGMSPCVPTGLGNMRSSMHALERKATSSHQSVWSVAASAWHVRRCLRAAGKRVIMLQH